MCNTLKYIKHFHKQFSKLISPSEQSSDEYIYFLISYFIHEERRTQRDLVTEGHIHLERNNFRFQMPCSFLMHLLYILCWGLVSWDAREACLNVAKWKRIKIIWVMQFKSSEDTVLQPLSFMFCLSPACHLNKEWLEQIATKESIAFHPASRTW